MKQKSTEGVTLTAAARDQIGTRRVRRIRKEGVVPGVIYGLDKDNVALGLARNELETAVRTGKKMLDLNLDGTTETVLLKDLQFDPLTDQVIHVDFERVAMDREVTIDVPITLDGKARGLEEKGVMEQVMRSIEVHCLPMNIPDAILVDVTDLGLGDSCRVSALQLPEGVSVTAGLEETVAVLHAPAVVEEEAPPEEVGPGEPEVLTRAPEDEETPQEEKPKEQE